MLPLSVFFGAIVGFSLGLTGGGGSIFAVPLLVYGLSVPARAAIGTSLAAVGATAFFGFVQRLRAGEVELRTGVLFAGAGMLGAPVGSWAGARVPEPMLLLSFAALMIVVALRMWRGASRAPAEAREVRAPIVPAPADAAGAEPVAHHRRLAALAVVGFLAGVLSGFFGVGGGFVIVPALVLFGGIAIHRAVATSLLVITLVSASGVASFVATGRSLDVRLTSLFVAGGIVGMALGTLLGRRLSGPRLQKVFAATIVVMAAIVIARTLAAKN